MSSHLLRVAFRASNFPQRAFSASPVCSKTFVLDQALKDEIHPKIGNREIVGFGLNGEPNYFDLPGVPCPSIRFKEDTPEALKLREKEKADWKSLSLEEKKTLYRNSFCQTYSEMTAKTGEWKIFAAAVLLTFGITGWLSYYVKTVVYTSLPRTFTREWQEASLQRMLDQGHGAVEGISSKWDYDKLEWKK